MAQLLRQDLGVRPCPLRISTGSRDDSNPCRLEETREEGPEPVAATPRPDETAAQSRGSVIVDGHDL